VHNAQELAKKEVDKYQEWQRVNDEVEKMKLCELWLSSGPASTRSDSEMVPVSALYSASALRYEPWLEYETASTSYTQICKVAKDSKKQYNQYLKKVDPLIKHRDDEKERCASVCAYPQSLIEAPQRPTG
jgi:hypothetical protein